MQSLPITKALLDSYVSHVSECTKKLWNENNMFQVTEINTEKVSVTLSDSRTVHIHTLLEQLKTFRSDNNDLKIAVTEFSDTLSKLAKTAYDYHGAKKIIEDLQVAAYKEALETKPKKILYDMYTSKAGTSQYNPKVKLAFYNITKQGRLAPKEYSEFAKTYVENFDRGFAEKHALREAKKKATRRCSNAVANSYPGDIDELIAWLKEYATGVFIKAAREEEFFESPTSEKCRLKSLESIETTIDDLMHEDKVLDNFELERNTGMFNCWEIRLRTGHKEAAPKAVHEWLYDKKVPGDIDTYELGTVYKSKLNKINSNPIVKDLVFNYGFKLGKY